MSKQLETPRLILRERTKELFDNILKKPIEEQLKFFGLATEEHLKEKLQQWDSSWENSLTFDIIHKKDDKVIGYIGFYRWFKEHFRSEIGYYLFEEYRRQGLMKEAVTTIIEFGYDQLNLYRIEALTSPENIASQNLLLNFPFKKEGILRQHYYDKGSLSDSVMYALLQPEWKDWQNK